MEMGWNYLKLVEKVFYVKNDQNRKWKGSLQWPLTNQIGTKVRVHQGTGDIGADGGEG